MRLIVAILIMRLIVINVYDGENIDAHGFFFFL